MTAEFGFELRVCRWAEQSWPPSDDGPADGAQAGAGTDGAQAGAGTDGANADAGTDAAVLVARQLGTKRRRWDTIVVETDADALARRAPFGERRLDADLLHVVRHAPATWTWYREALPDPGHPWRYVREAVHRAADRGVVETRRADGNRIELRRRWRYPDWARRVVAIENKPDLDASAARDLAPQIERDVAMGLADEVWVATRATDERIEPILLEAMPVEAGILVFDFDADDPATVEWHPRTLSPAEPGTRILDRPTGGRYDASAARFEYVPADEKAAKRREIAERAYERGWRSYAESMRADCRHFTLAPEGDSLLPHCRAKGREQTAAECAASCPDFEPEPPAWRQKGWPLDGGPGKAVKRLLAERRARRR
ncbi:MAG TPA: DUF5787 family protein [Halobacteriales archaeon]|nr:DUF5787 family protein [Halobacteriales archaeon]